MHNEAARVAIGHVGWQIKKQNAETTRDTTEEPITSHHNAFCERKAFSFGPFSRRPLVWLSLKLLWINQAPLLPPESV